MGVESGSNHSPGRERVSRLLCRWRPPPHSREVPPVLRNQSLRATIAVAFASLLMIMAAVIAFAVREMEATQAQRRLVSDALLPAADAADRMALNALKFDDGLQAYVETRSPEDLGVAH